MSLLKKYTMYLKNTLQICSKITSNQFIAQFHLLNVIKSKKKTNNYIYGSTINVRRISFLLPYNGEHSLKDYSFLQINSCIFSSLNI